MSSPLRSSWDTVVGLVVDDGQLALGIVIALGITGAWSLILPEPVRGYAGWLLVAMLVLLVLGNLSLAGRKAREHVAEAATRRSG